MADLRVDRFPPELKAQLKIAAVKSGKTLRELIIERLKKGATQ
jgi:predicted HicB family RNase H-like nuclease